MQNAAHGLKWECHMEISKMSYLESSDLGNEQLIAIIRDRILKNGPITFEAFMDMALYYPEYGYYTSGSEPVGTDGDYVTSPTMHPAFGAMIARWLHSKWQEMGSPERFDVVEMGAGKGLLCSTVVLRIEELYPDFLAAIDYTIVERRRSSSCIGPNSGIEFVDELSSIPDGSIEGCIFSNELVDAFPVHLVTMDSGRLQEILIGVKEDRFVEIFDEPSTPEISDYFDRLGIVLPDGYRTEVNLRALDWNKTVAKKLKEGYVLTVDYGYTADQYYSPERCRGTLICYYRHTYTEDPYIRIGKQDITAHVDFTSCIGAGEEVGLEAESLTSQRDFLMNQGIEEFMATSPGRRAMMSLIDPRGMGGFKVMIQKKTSEE